MLVIKINAAPTSSIDAISLPIKTQSRKYPNGIAKYAKTAVVPTVLYCHEAQKKATCKN